MVSWWGTPKKTSRLLRLEVEVMKRAYGDTFQLNLIDWEDRNKKKDKRICWVGTVHINMDVPGNPKDHTLQIVYPSKYPNVAPEAYPIDPVIEPIPGAKNHIYPSGELCLYDPRKNKREGWNPSNSTGVTIAGWAIQWFYAYYTWKATGKWPGDEARH